MLPTSIRATVHEDAIGRVGAFFNATAEDMIREIFQNARRSGAKLIEVTIDGKTDAAGRRRVSIADDGCGIADPAALLAFGHSRWEDLDHENPAGMGVYALASTECTIASRTAGMETGWQVTLDPTHYRGEAAAAATAAPATTPVGTRIDLKSSGITAGIVRDAARFLPVKVKVNGRAAPQQEFQEAYGETGNASSGGVDVTFAIRPGHLGRQDTRRVENGIIRAHQTTINFHGHLVQADIEMPAVAGIGQCWYANIDVHDCPELQLVLPTRKDIVRNDFVDELRERAEAAIFTTLDSLAEPVNLRYDAWSRGCRVLGRTLHRTLQRQPVRLVPWLPTTPENQEQRDTEDGGSPRTPGDKALVIPSNTPAPLQVLLARALEESETEPPRVYAADPRCEGFGEYDRLYKVRDATLMVTETDGTTHRADEPGAPRTKRRVRSMELVLYCCNEAGGPERQVRVPTEIGFCECNTERMSPESVGILLTEDADPHPDTLITMLLTAYYARNDAADQSDTTQRKEFLDSARQHAEQMLLPGTSGAERAIRRALDQSVGKLLNDKGPMVIRYEPFRACSIEHPEPEQGPAAG